MAAAATIFTAPPSWGTPSCTSAGVGTVCQSPGNTQIKAAQPPANTGTKYQYPFWKDGFIGGPGFVGWGYNTGQNWGYGASEGWGSLAQPAVPGWQLNLP